MRRILAFILSLIFIFTLFPTSILADDGEEIDENNINDIGTNSEEIPNENGNIPIITKFEIEKEVLIENEVEIEKELPIFYLIVPFDSEYDDIEWPETIVGYLNNSDSSSKIKVLKWVKTEDHFNEEFEGENKITYIPTFDESEYRVANGVHLPYGVIEYQEDLIDEENVESTIEPTEEPSTEPEETETPSTTPEGTPEVTEEPSESLNPTDTPEVTNTPEETVEPTDTPEVTEEPTETPGPTVEPTETPTVEPTEVPTSTTEPTQEPVVEYSDLIETEESKNEPLLQTKELSKETRQIINTKNGNETSPSIHELRDFPDTVILDDITIENFTVRWLSKSTGSDTSAKFDRLELVANDDNTVGNQQFQIDFKLSSQHQYEPGTIELVFPAYLWLDRDGNEPGKLTLSVPEEGEGNANFAWKRIGDNIIITNTRKLNASSVVMLQGTFRDVDPSKMVDIDVVDTENNLYLGISKEFYVTLNIESSEGNTTSIDSNGIDASINTESNIFKLAKTAFDKPNNEYKIWFSVPEDLPVEFIPENSDDYVYVRWYVSGIISGSQEYTMYLEESVESNSKILGIQSDYSGNIVASDSNHIKEVIFDGFTLASKSAYVWMAYPKSMFNDEDYTNVENTATISIIGKDDEVEKSEDITAETPIKLPITYTIKKIWDDNDDEHEKRPTEIWYRIDYDYNDKHDYFYKYATEDTNWEVSWSDDGKKISYFVQEMSNSLDGTHPLRGTYEAYYDENGNKYIKSWNYSIKSTNYDSNLHTWTFTNEYSEGTHVSLVSSFSKFNTQDQYSHTNIDYILNRSLSTLYNQGSTEIPYGFTSQIDFFSHKNNDYTPTVIIEDYNLKLNDIDLTSDEYEFNFITFSKITNYSYSEKVDDEGYYIPYNIIETNPINIYGYINDEWTLIATYTKTEQTALVDGAEWIYTTRLKFPENVTKIKLELTPNETDLCLIEGNISVRLKLSDRIKSWIESDYENSIYTMMNCSNSAQQYIINKDTNDEILDEQFNLHQSTCALWLHGRSIKVAGTLDKEFKYMDNDVVDRRLKFRSTLTLNLQSTLDNYSQYIEAINNGEIPNTNSGIYYDLLPYGVEPDLDSIGVVGGTLKNAYVIENYKNSGRTLLVAIVNQTNNITKMNAHQISLEHREGDYPHDTYRNSHSIYFDCYYSWESAMEYGIDNMYNYAAYEADEEIIANYPEYSGEPNDPTVGNNITSQLIDGDNINLLTNLGSGRTTNSFIYGAALLDTSEIDFSALTSLQKHVSVSGSGKWGQGLIEPIDVQAGSYYTYRIYVQSATDTETSNIVLFDSIENYIPTEEDEDYGDTQWHGTFLELDVREMINMGANPIVYYSTIANLDISEYGDNVQSHLLNDEIDGQKVWSTTIPDNPSDVKAIAIDITKKQNGEDFILYPDEIAMAYIKMKAPEGEAVISAFNGTNGEDPTLNAHAYNGLWLSASQNTLGSLNNEFSHFEYTKLGIYSFNIYVEKVWDDENNNDGYRPNSITIHLYKDGVDTNETLILNEENEWKGQFENITKFNDDKIPYNYTISEDEIPEYITQINQSFNHFTVTNTHIPEQVIITVDKTWVDDEDVKDRIRPNYITYHLYSNGEELNKPSYTLTSSDNWTNEISVNKYLNGEIINYSIIENEVNFYKITYSNEDYSFHIINTYYPYGNLSITKEIQNETPQSENQQFKLSISLVDSDGDDLIDKYYYESTTGRIGLVGNGDTLTISANETITIKDLPHNARYKIQEESAFGWELIGSSNLTGLIKFNSTKEATLINKYTTSGRASISGHKELIGRELRKYLFQFNLYDEYNNHIAAASNNANGDFVFGDRKYSNEDNGKTFYYCIIEQDKGKQGYTYDIETYYIVEIKPVDNGNGTMTCSVKYYIYDEESENTIEIGEERPEIIPVTEITQEEVIFRNEYHAEGYLSIRSWKDITGGKLENRQFTFKLESIANNNNEYYLTTPEHMDESSLILPPIGDDEEQEDPVPYITTGYNNSDGSIIFNTPFRDNKLRFTENDIGKTYRFIIYEVKDNDNRITYDDSIFGYEITVYDNGDGTLSFSSIPAKPITQSSICEICNGTGTILTDPENSDSEQTICNNCNGTGYIIEIIDWEIENAQIPVFHNKYNDGNLAITKLVEGENYDPNQEFTFHVKLIGDYNIDELEYMLSQFDSNVQHTLTIHYGYYIIDKITEEKTWTSITEDYTHLYTYKEEYNIQNPEVEGYTLSSYENESVSGIMGLNNIEIYVEYTKNRNTTTGGASGLGILGYPMTLNIKLPILMDIQPADDATIEQTGTCGECTWELYSDGTLIIKPTNGVSGTLNNLNITSSVPPWYNYRTQIKQVNIESGVKSNSNCSYMFYNCTNLISADLSKFDTSNATNMYGIFYNCSSLESLNVSNFDTSNVTTMQDMFRGCSSLASLDLSSFNTSNVTIMYSMFYNCSSLESLDVSNFNTSNVTNMNSMFYNCRSLESLNVSNFDTSNVTTMQDMFYGCSSLASLDLSSFNTSNVTYMPNMFYGCSSLESLDVSNFNTSNVTIMNSMFYNCSSLESLDVSSFDTSNATNMTQMFYGCSSLETLDVSNFNTSNVTNMNSMFNKCSLLESLDLSSFNTSNATNMSSMFSGCNSLESLDVSNWNTSNVTNMSSMFKDCSSLKSLDVSNFNTSNVTNMSQMFYRCNKLETLDLNNWNTSNVTGMSSMFYGCSLLESLDLSSFNTSNATNMSSMFSYCSSLESLDLSNFDTSNVTTMQAMFNACRSLESLDLSNFNTSNVTNMSLMFSDCSSLETLDVSNFNTSNVTNMHYMFSYCSSLSEIKLGENFKFSGRNITNNNDKAILPTPPIESTTGKWIREDEIYGPYTATQLRDIYDTNSSLYAGTWIWEEIPTTYKIIFSTEDENVIGSMSNQKIVASENGIINENQFRKFAYKFIGWHDETNDRDWLLGENTEITIPANTYTAGTILTFTPIFEAIDTHVTIEDGEFVFTLHANETATFTLPAGITYQITEDLPKGWTLLSQENSSGTIIPVETQNAVFTNQYIPNIVQVNIMGTKLLNGRASNIEFDFSLELINFEPVNENEEPILTREDEYQETWNNNSGMIMFEPLVFETVGTYHYKVVEIYRDDPFRPSIYSFDSHEEEITIVVSEDEDGTLYATVTKDEDGIIFRNYYKPGSLTIEKIAEGLTEANMNSEFTIRVKFFNENGTPLQDGAISYEVIGSTIEENREGESLLTIRYYDEDYNIVAPIYSEWLQEGSEYSIESPIIENMITEIERVEGTIGTNNIYINVPYTHTGHKLTIRYIEAPEGYIIPENPNIVILNDELIKKPDDDPDTDQIELYQRYIGWFNEGEEYNIPNPEIENYETINESVSGIMGSENIEIIVYYTYSREFTLTIKYGYWEKSFISLTDDYIIQLKQGASYSIESPIIEGYTTNTLVVEGVMGNDNQTIYVEYVAK